MPKYAQINYGQVVQISMYESLEEIYTKYYTKEIQWVPCDEEVLVGWDYDGTSFIKPHKEGYRYATDGESWMLVENTIEENNIIEDLRNFRIAQNRDIIDYSIDNYTKELIDNALV